MGLHENFYLLENGDSCQGVPKTDTQGKGRSDAEQRSESPLCPAMYWSTILETVLLQGECLGQAYNDACCHFMTFPMDALTPFWDYHGCCVRPYLPLRPVCFQEDPLIPLPKDLQWGVHMEWTLGPKLTFLMAPCTDQLIWCQKQDQGQHRYLTTPDFRGHSSSAKATIPEVQWYANITHREVWLHDDDGAKTHLDWPTEGADGWEIKERPYDYFCWQDQLQSRECLQRDYKVLQPATKHPMTWPDSLSTGVPSNGASDTSWTKSQRPLNMTIVTSGT